MPAPVVRRAAQLLAALEKHGGPLGAGAPLGALPLFAAPVEEVAAEGGDTLREALEGLDPDRMSPRGGAGGAVSVAGDAGGCGGFGGDGGVGDRILWVTNSPCPRFRRQLPDMEIAPRHR